MKQHTDAVIALARTVPAFASKTFVSFATRDATGKLPNPTYLLVHPSDGSDQITRLAGPALTQRPRFTFHVVGSSYDNVAAGVALLKAKFVPGGIGHIFTLPGELCGQVWWSSPIPIQVDNDITPPLVYAVIELGFTAEPSA